MSVEGLNPAQREAVEHDRGPLIVLAGPGTGKTRVITHRIARILKGGAAPESILALTFTNRAAEELRARLIVLAGAGMHADRIHASTFHSFGLRLIRRYADLIGWRSEPKIIDETRERRLMREIVTKTRIGLRATPYDPLAIVEPALIFISRASNSAMTPALCRAAVEARRTRLAASPGETEDARIAAQVRLARLEEFTALFELFEEECLSRGWATFDDLQSRPIRMLREDRRVAALVRSEIRHVVVDEFQDVNQAQIELLKLICPPAGDICVVGDDDQSIYAFRGAYQAAFTTFRNHWAGSEVVRLSENYRSSGVVLSAAQHVIERCSDRFDSEKTVTAAGPLGSVRDPVVMVEYAGKSGHAPQIASMIAHAIERGLVRPAECAVLARTNKDLPAVAAALAARGIAAEIARPEEAEESPAVTDLKAWLHVLADGRDSARLFRVLMQPPLDVPLSVLTRLHGVWRRIRPQRADLASHETIDIDPPMSFIDWLRTQTDAIGEHPSMARFLRLHDELRSAALTQEAAEVVEAVLKKTGMLTLDLSDETDRESRTKALLRYLAVARTVQSELEEPKRLGDLLRHLDDLNAAGLDPFSTPGEMLDAGEARFSQDNAVRLLTAHQSKGLEFDWVFLPRLNQWGYTLKGVKPEREEESELDELLESFFDTVRTTTENEERRLFFVALTRARQRLILLTQVRQEGGRRVSPSEFWKEVLVMPVEEVPRELSTLDALGADGPNADEAVLEASRDAAEAMRRRAQQAVRRRVTSALHAAGERAANPLEVARAAGSLAFAGYACALVEVSHSGVRAMEALIEQTPEVHREELRTFAKHYLSPGAGSARHAGVRGPLNLTFSEIEEYLRCPACYWLRFVIGLPEKAYVGSKYGSIVHQALERFYKQVMDHGANPEHINNPTLQDLLRQGRAAIVEIADEQSDPRGLLAQVEAGLRKYYETLHTQSINPIAVEHKEVFEYRVDEATHRITVRFDRLDADERGHHIIDYKTGRPKKEYIEPKEDDLQMGAYALALANFVDDAAPTGTAEYWLASTGQRGVLDLREINFEKVRKKIDKAICGILGGEWPRGRGCERLCVLLEPIVAERV